MQRAICDEFMTGESCKLPLPLGEGWGEGLAEKQGKETDSFLNRLCQRSLPIVFALDLYRLAHLVEPRA